MKEKEPNKPFFSADESPVPLPSVEDAWADMRKKLDEEMPERALFFWFKRGMGILLLLLLSLAAFLLIRRTGGSVRHDVGVGGGVGGAIVRAKDTGNGAGGPGKAAAEEAAKKPSAKGLERMNVGAARDSGSARSTGSVRLIDGSVRNNGSGRNNGLGRLIVGAGRTAENTGLNGGDAGLRKNRRQIPGQDQAGRPGLLRQKDNANTKNLQKVIIDTRLVQVGTRDLIPVKVNMPRKTTGTGKKNAPAPQPAKKSKPADSTRILWAAGLQDSKSFPVGAQQAYDYDANLKKDIWADYIPSPYFQYHISKKIYFQTALQLNNPQYTESVTIFRKAGDSTSGVQVTNDTTVMVRKLYYFNIPLMVYYSPLRNVYLGAGLQFSNLSNGIAFQNNIVHHVGASSLTDTVLTTDVINLKENRPAYSNLRKTDWRALFELNYYWKRITLGLQYQQALGDYLYVPVEGSSGMDRNSSFNIYLRYNLWERRIKIAPGQVTSKN